MTIDTLKFVRRLQAAGVPLKQAEAEAEAIQEALEAATATKSDIVGKGEIGSLKGQITKLEGRFTTLEGQVITMKGQISTPRAD